MMDPPDRTSFSPLKSIALIGVEDCCWKLSAAWSYMDGENESLGEDELEDMK